MKQKINWNWFTIMSITAIAFGFTNSTYGILLFAVTLFNFGITHYEIEVQERRKRRNEKNNI